MRIIKKSGLNKKNAVPLQYRNATYFYSHQSISGIFHEQATHVNSPWGNFKTNQYVTSPEYAFRISFKSNSSCIRPITVLGKRQEERIKNEIAVRTGKVENEFSNLCPILAVEQELKFIGKFMQGSARKSSVSVKHNLGWFYHGIKKAYFSAPDKYGIVAKTSMREKAWIDQEFLEF
jgi:hypothetical protein